MTDDHDTPWRVTATERDATEADDPPDVLTTFAIDERHVRERYPARVGLVTEDGPDIDRLIGQLAPLAHHFVAVAPTTVYVIVHDAPAPYDIVADPVTFDAVPDDGLAEAFVCRGANGIAFGGPLDNRLKLGPVDELTLGELGVTLE